MIWSLLRKVLFSLDPEMIHELTISALASASRVSLGRGTLRLVSGQTSDWNPSSFRVWHLDFRSRVGLAAGFDKNARLLRALPHLGFGFAEIGSVTPRPQLGNPRPRLRRYPHQEALWNSMGFNNDGIEVVASRLEQARAEGWIPKSFPIGVNLGKNKDTPLGEAHLDYLKGAKRFLGLADYLVINVSSPNTTGLRELQQVDRLTQIVGPILEARAGSPFSATPILLKLAPEIEGQQLGSVITQLDSWVDGWILTNTLGDQGGGLSGSPLRQVSEMRLREALESTNHPVISSGGILSVEEARSRLKNGASLLQVYTGYVYQGPTFPAEIARKTV